MKLHVRAPFLLIILSLFVFSCGQTETEADLLKKAQTFEEEGKYQEALHALKKLVRDYPEGINSSKALHRSAFISYNNLNDFQQSIDFHRSLIEKFPDSEYVPRALFMIGFIYANDLKKFDEAKASYDDFMAKYPEHELVESVKWELEHLGQDVDEQLKDLFGEESNKEQTMSN